MWVLPRPVPLTEALLFFVLKQQGIAQLQQVKTGFFTGFMSTVNQASYETYRLVALCNWLTNRIVVTRSDGTIILLAVSASLKKINEHWDFLQKNLIDLVCSMIKDPNDQLQLLLDKVSALSQLEEGEEGKNETKIHEFRHVFPKLKAEKFVTCTEFS